MNKGKMKDDVLDMLEKVLFGSMGERLPTKGAVSIDVIDAKPMEKDDPKLAALEEMMGRDLDNDNEEGEDEDHREAVLGDCDEEDEPEVFSFKRRK